MRATYLLLGLFVIVLTLLSFSVHAEPVHDLVTASAQRHGVPVSIAHAIVKTESGYNCKARNRSGASGIMQILPRTARGVGVSGSLLNCATGLEAGMRYLAGIVRLYGTSCAALSLYERGTGARPACTGYARKVLANAGSNSQVKRSTQR